MGNGRLWLVCNGSSLLLLPPHTFLLLQCGVTAMGCSPLGNILLLWCEILHGLQCGYLLHHDKSAGSRQIFAPHLLAL